EDEAVIRGGALVRKGAYLEIQDARVNSHLDLRGSYGVFADRATLGFVETRNSGFFHAEETTQQAYHGINTQASWESAWAEGDVTTRQSEYIDINDSVVTGGLEIRNSEEGSVVCSSEIDGPVLIQGTSGGVVQVGVGSYPDCAGNVFADDLDIRANRTSEGT